MQSWIPAAVPAFYKRSSSEPTAHYGQPGVLLLAVSSTDGRAWAAISATSSAHGMTLRTTSSSRGWAPREPPLGAATATTPRDRGVVGSIAVPGPRAQFHTTASTTRQVRGDKGN